MNFLFKFFILGVVTSFLFPPFFLLPIGFIVFPYLFYLINKISLIKYKYPYQFLCGFFYGFGFLFIYLGWIKEPFLLDDLTKNFSIFSYLLIIYCSFFYGLTFLLLSYIKKPIIKFILLPSIFILSEFIIANFSYGFPWISHSLIHSANIFGTSMIYYIGTYGLSYLTIFIFLFPSIILFKKKKYYNVLISIYFFIFITIIFLLLARYNKSGIGDSDSLEISLAQINYPVNQDLDEKKLQNKFKSIVEIIKTNKSDILIFAENNYPYLINNKNEINYLKTITKKESNVIIGLTTKKDNEFYNSLYIFNNQILKKFDKKILVPFGEFIPLRSFFSFMEFIAGSSDYSKGNDRRLIQLDNGINIVPVICYEIIYFWRLLDQENKNANLIVNITNDSWFGKFSGPYQHFYFTKLRASEFNKPLIRVSNNGVSATINNYGKVIDFIKLNEKETKISNININNDLNNYIEFHKFIIYLIFMSIFFGYILNARNDS